MERISLLRSTGSDIRGRVAISEPTQLLGTYLGSGPGRPEYEYRAEMIFVRHPRGNEFYERAPTIHSARRRTAR